MQHQTSLALLVSSLLLTACGGGGGSGSSNQTRTATETDTSPALNTLSLRYQLPTWCHTTVNESDYQIYLYDAQWQQVATLEPDKSGLVTFETELENVNLVKVKMDDPSNPASQQQFTIVENLTVEDHGDIFIDEPTKAGCECRELLSYVSMSDDFRDQASSVSINIGFNDTFTPRLNIDEITLNTVSDQTVCKVTDGDYPTTLSFIRSTKTTADGIENIGLLSNNIDYENSDNAWLVWFKHPAEHKQLTNYLDEGHATLVKNLTYLRQGQAIYQAPGAVDSSIISFETALNNHPDISADKLSYRLLSYNPMFSLNLPGDDEQSNNATYYFRQDVLNTLAETDGLAQINMVASNLYQDQILNIKNQPLGDLSFDYSDQNFDHSRVDLFFETTEQLNPAERDNIHIRYFGHQLDSSEIPFAKIIADALPEITQIEVKAWDILLGGFDITDQGNYKTEQAVLLSGSYEQGLVEVNGILSTSYSISLR
ncbi:hypothetical protein HR060_09790 [Catenovulum sp. SM1970]|uniref:hypothetical protein n=1 Tax=Marinifaba aquimaris TaxID=2741323 RepID=UPI00157484DB|nr:hypothetical protein [Marinifaba aquimaris]NTS77154.1 hypothetical protein [Marinifaba aquimaris]